MKKKIFISIIMITVIVTVSTNIFASSFLNSVISQGTAFGKGSSSGMGSTISSFIKGDILYTIANIGYLVFAAVTVILGAKYIWSSAEGKAEVMESLPGFVLAVVFFYSCDRLVAFFTDTTLANATTWNTIAGRVIGTINLIVRYVAFGGILFIGLKYLFASAEGKAQMKTSATGLVIGIIFVFMASMVVDFIIGAASTVIG